MFPGFGRNRVYRPNPDDLLILWEMVVPAQVLQAIDEELAQSKARFLISCIVALVAGIFANGSGSMAYDVRVTCFIVIFSYLAFSGLWYLMVRWYPGKAIWRRNISLIADLGIMSVFMDLGGQPAALFYPLFLWIIIGNGIRFGEKLLVKGIVLGVVGFGWVLLNNPYWKANLEAGLGLLLGVVILPIFFLGVLRRLKAIHDLRIQLAESRLVDQAKDEFLAAMSHELRTPMNGVLGMAEILGTTSLDAEQKGHLQVITRSVESLLHVINDILDYSRIKAKSLVLAPLPVDLKETLGDVVQIMANVAGDKGIKMDLDFPDQAPRFFLLDATRVRQIVFNLVGNAVKFTDQGSVMVACRVLDDPTRPNVVLTISDTGIGIPEDRLRVIFDHFEQGDNSTTRKYGGTGLGLAISQQLAQLMGGEIKVTSTPGKGSAFTVHLSLDPCPEPHRESTPVTQEFPNFGLSALVVEDNKINQVVIKNILKKIGVKVDVAENGAVAVEMVTNGRYDVVFMDVRMPVMNGYDATRAIRKLEGPQGQVPILAVTGEATKADVQKCLESGMDRHLAKPIGIEMLIEALEELPEIASSRGHSLVHA